MKQLFTLLSIFILVGCTITKRSFNSGYHVEWKKTYSKEKNESNKLNLSDSREQRSNESEIQLQPTITSTDSIDLSTQKNEPIIVDEFISNETSSKEIEESEPVEAQNQQIQEKRVEESQDETVDEVELKTEPLTWVSLILLFIAGIALGMIGLYGSILFVGSGILITCLMIAMFVCSLISVIRIHRNPDLYKNKGLTSFLFSFSIICLITAIIYLIGISALASMSPMLQGI